MGKKHFGFFQTAETGNRAPNSGVKGSGANHYPRAPARSHLESIDLLNRYQSEYRPMHSTETALLKVQNDLLRNLDYRKTTVLVLLDLSAAIDTLNHSGVIGLWKNWYGISGNALRWFASYLMDRQQMETFPRRLKLHKTYIAYHWFVVLAITFVTYVACAVFDI